jgi:hypothetical protein
MSSLIELDVPCPTCAACRQAMHSLVLWLTWNGDQFFCSADHIEHLLMCLNRISPSRGARGSQAMPANRSAFIAPIHGPAAPPSRPATSCRFAPPRLDARFRLPLSRITAPRFPCGRPARQSTLYSLGISMWYLRQRGPPFSERRACLSHDPRMEVPACYHPCIQTDTDYRAPHRDGVRGGAHGCLEDDRVQKTQRIERPPAGLGDG